MRLQDKKNNHIFPLPAVTSVLNNQKWNGSQKKTQQLQSKERKWHIADQKLTRTHLSSFDTRLSWEQRTDQSNVFDYFEKDCRKLIVKIYWWHFSGLCSPIFWKPPRLQWAVAGLPLFSQTKAPAFPMYLSQITGCHIRGGLPEMIYDTSGAKMWERVAEGRRHTDVHL